MRWFLALGVAAAVIGSLGIGGAPVSREYEAAVPGLPVKDLLDLWSPSPADPSNLRPSLGAFFAWAREATARAALEGSSDPATPPPEFPFLGPSHPDYQLLPFDDANGDDRMDPILTSNTPEGEPVLSVLDGSRPGGPPLWALQPAPSGWYTSGDLTADGVADLVVLAAEEPDVETTSAGVVQQSKYDAALRFQVINGASGRPAFVVEGRMASEETWASAGTGPAYAWVNQFRFTYPFLASTAVGSGAGSAMLVEFTFGYRGAVALAADAYASVSLYESTLMVHSFDAEGKPTWSLEVDPSPGVVAGAFPLDATGDGQLDVGVLADLPQGYATTAAAFASLDARRAELFVYDAKTGSEAWSVFGSPFVGYLQAGPLGDVDGDKRHDLALVEYRVSADGASPSMETRFRFLSGADGSDQRSDTYPAEVRYPIPFGPVDATAGAEVLVLAGPVDGFDPTTGPQVSEARLSMETAVGTVLWERAFSLEELGRMDPLLWGDWLRDFDGDGATDLVYGRTSIDGNPEHELVVGLLSGGSGATVYERAVPFELWSSVPVADIDNDGGADLVALTVEAVGRPMREPSMGGPAPEPPTSTPDVAVARGGEPPVSTNSATARPCAMAEDKPGAAPKGPVPCSGAPPIHHRVHLLAARGADLGLLWVKVLHGDPAFADPPLEETPRLTLFLGGPGPDGRDELLVSINQGMECCVILIAEEQETGDAEGDGPPPPPSRPVVPGSRQAFSRVAVVGSLAGQPRWALPDYVPTEPVAVANELTPAPPPATQGHSHHGPFGIPATSGLLVLAALCGFVLIMRRRAPGPPPA